MVVVVVVDVDVLVDVDVDVLVDVDVDVDVDVEVEGSTIVDVVDDVVVVSGTVDDVADPTVVGAGVVGDGGLVVAGWVGGGVGRVVGVVGRVVGGRSVVVVVDVVVVIVGRMGFTNWSGPMLFGKGQPGGDVVVVTVVADVSGGTTAADVDGCGVVVGGAVVDVLELDVVVLLVDEVVLDVVDVVSGIAVADGTGTTSIGTVVGVPTFSSGPPGDPPATTQ